MKIGFYFYYLTYSQTKMFEVTSSENGEDDVYSFYYLALKLRELGHEIEVLNMDELDKYDKIVFFDTPALFSHLHLKLKKLQKKTDLYLFLNENPAVKPLNWIRPLHRPFKKIFVWNKSWVDNKKYFHWIYSFKPKKLDLGLPFQERKLLTMINHQKYSPHPRELFSERTKAIRWFEMNSPADFDLYGDRWNRLYFKGILSILNPKLRVIYQNNSWIPKIKTFPSWRGFVDRKNDVLQKYRFSICFENADFPGWVTEKMYDSLYCGCIPIFLGCKEVEDFFPESLYINFKNFKNYDSLLKHISSFNEKDYEDFLKSLNIFLESEKLQLRNPDNFVNLFKTHIINS